MFAMLALIFTIMVVENRTALRPLSHSGRPPAPCGFAREFCYYGKNQGAAFWMLAQP